MWVFFPKSDHNCDRFFCLAHMDLLVSIIALLIVAGTEILYVNRVADSLVLLLLAC